MAEDAEFLPAKELNKAQRKIAAAASRGKHEGRYCDLGQNILPVPNDDVSEDNLTRRLNTAVAHMREDDYFLSFAKVLDEALVESQISFNQIVCYGLGSFGSNMTSRYQLAFLILLKEKMGNIRLELYDPSFTPNEIKVMSTTLDFIVLEENEEGHRLVRGDGAGVLFFMPHAPHQLVNNLIYTNWTPESISKCVCICNSFENLKVNFPKRVLQQNLGYIDRSERIVVEYGIINTFPYKDIFNDMAIHSFPLGRIKELHLPAEYWEKCFKPQYKQLEFVQAHQTENLPRNFTNLDKTLYQ